MEPWLTQGVQLVQAQMNLAELLSARLDAGIQLGSSGTAGAEQVVQRQRIVALLQAASELEPLNRHVREALGQHLGRLATAFASNDELGSALQACEASLVHARRLSEESPSIDRYGIQLSNLLSNHEALLLRLGQVGED